LLDRSHVMTVLGPIAPAALGSALMHEHLLCDLRPLGDRGSIEPDTAITLDNAFAATYRPGGVRGNYRLQDVSRATREAASFAAVGGGTIVDEIIQSRKLSAV